MMAFIFSKLLLRNSSEGQDKNLCFTNAAVQVLRNVPQLRQIIVENPLYPSAIQNEIKTLLEFENTNKSLGK